ncbi:uncharacterized protein BXZ73DRAFT_39344 [Epithele typhae]|uniref:uncharacterized protein n=1 Tax=Epithele typhae TaxID=378194 RepID=UPI002007F9E0|nr:uncharacterized protein BXZ73DRAFT_39344 [Epithele typhae]KAH9944034.1 hypothetical protein BXZ73DRAFT_39344 [Epithele typhae]
MADIASPSSSSDLSSRLTHVDTELQRTQSADIQEKAVSHSAGLEAQEVPSEPQQTRTRWDRLFKTVVTDHPKVLRVWNYVRGPRPKVDLPDLVPLLNRTFSWRRIHFSVALEAPLLRYTRPLTNPWLFVVLAAGWIIGFAFWARSQSFLTPVDSFIGCTATYWPALDACGLNGESCAPFDNATFDFRCPAQCASVVLANPRTVGAEQVDRVPLIVGGGDGNGTYRGDTFVCAAALQAGLISNSKGGCASLQLVGNFTEYLPLARNGLTSIGFPSVFPLSFQFLPTTPLHSCEDNRNEALAFNVIITALIFLILRPKAIVTYWCLVCIGFWHITLFSEPRGTPPPLDEAFQSFLPCLFVAYAFWRLAFRFTMPAFRRAPIEAAVWYLVPFWIGILSNIILDKIPVDRLIASDISARPGALAAVIIIALIVLVIFVNQCRVVRKTGYLPQYLGWYIVGGLITLVLALLPGLQIRIHHYIFAMVFIPGTGFPTRLSAIYQAFLLGLFLNGIAAFGFDSVLQTQADLVRDAALGTDLPTFLTNSTSYNSSIPFINQTILWDALPDGKGWDGFALLVDDVERYVGDALNYTLSALEPNIVHFFRLAFTSGGTAGDFTMAAQLFPNGTWVDPAPGPS